MLLSGRALASHMQGPGFDSYHRQKRKEGKRSRRRKNKKRNPQGLKVIAALQVPGSMSYFIIHGSQHEVLL